MATSGSKSTQFTDYDQLVFAWDVISTDTTKNTTTIGWRVQLVSGDYGAISSSVSKNLTVSIVGVQTYSAQVSITINNNTSRTLFTGTSTIQHNLNGTGSFTYVVTLEANIIFSGKTISTVGITGTGTLNRIDRRSTIAATDAYCGGTSTLYLTSYDTSFTHTLTYSFGDETGTIRENTSDAVVYWTIPDSFWYQLPDTIEDICTITCQTYTGNTLIGVSYAFPTIRTGDVPPEFTVTFADTSGSLWDYTGGSSRSIRYLSSLWYSIDATPAPGATITDYRVVYGDTTYTGQSGELRSSAYLTALVEVTDSRGATASETVALNMADYFYPTAVLKPSRLTTDGEITLNISGKIFNQRFDNGSGGQANYIDVLYRYKEEGEEEYYSWYDINGEINATAESYTASTTLTDLDYTKSYTFQVRVYDALNQSDSLEITVRSTPVFDWGPDDFAFNVPVSIQGGSVPTLIDAGTDYTGWQYRKWSDGTAECWISQNFLVDITGSWGGLYTSGAISGSNLSFPTDLFIATPNIQASLLTRSTGGILMAPGGAGSNIASKDQTGVYEIARGTSISNGAFTINYYARGNWK